MKTEAHNLGISLNQIVLKRLKNDSPSSLTLALLTKIEKKFSPIGVIQFGSTVMGKSHDGSDIDLLIVMPSDVPLTKDQYEAWDKLKINSKFSPHFAHLPKDQNKYSSLWLEVALFGIPVLDSLGVLKKEIYKVKDLISQGKYIRKLTHGQPYWINKMGEKKDAQ
jgi:predicted nucleotidyltransferase